MQTHRAAARRSRRGWGWIGAALVAVAAAAGPAAAGKNWMQFRGPGGSATSEDANVPTRWSADRNVVWKAELPGAGASSPIIVGKRVFLTCFRGYGVPGQTEGGMNRLRRSLLCVSRADGEIDWIQDLAVQQPEQPRTRENHGYASSTPVSDGRGVFVFCGKSGVFAFSVEGRPLWHANVGAGLSGWGSAASPVLHGNAVIVNASVEDQSLVALDKRTGRRAWRVGGIKEAWNTPLLAENADGDVELIVAIPRKVLAFNPATGEALWTCETDITWYMVPSMTAHEGIVYCIGGRSGKAASLAIRMGGKGDVTKTHRLWRTEKFSNVSSPVYHDGRLYFAQEQRGVATCLDAKTGKVIYEQPFVPRSGQVYASPVLAGGNLYYPSRRNGVYVVPVGATFRVLAHNTLDDRSTFNATPAVAGDRLFLRSDAGLYCLGTPGEKGKE